jgi:divalent metal cation (Fe/Co/Zn/Cd) transporter
MSGQLTAARRRELNRRARRLAQFTIGYNIVEAAIMIGAGIAAGLVSVIGFGVDSGIESISAVLVLSQISIRLRHGHSHEDTERRVLKAVALTFFLLAAYVVGQGVRDLVSDETPDQSPLGMAVLLASLIVMPILGRAKQQVGRELGDNLILADAAETWICLLMSVSTLLGLVAFRLSGAAWIDPVAGFVVAAFAVYEGKEAWEGESAPGHGDDNSSGLPAPAVRGCQRP